VHLPSTYNYERYLGKELGLGTLAAHPANCLPLLPSGPDGVHSLELRKTQSSSPFNQGPDFTVICLGQEFNPAIAGCRYRAPLPPRLARYSNYTGTGTIFQEVSIGYMFAKNNAKYHIYHNHDTIDNKHCYSNVKTKE